MIYYTDGSARPNPGLGGCAFMKYNNKGKFEQCYRCTNIENATNNSMELHAILDSLYDIRDFHTNELNTIYTDSSYCYNIVTNWIYDWKNNNWLRSKNQPIENLDLIKNIYDFLIKLNNIEFKLIKGHSKIEGNEFADKLATNEISVKDILEYYKEDKENK